MKKMCSICLWSLPVFAALFPVQARDPVRAVRLAGKITVDGALREPVWSAGPATSGFLQLEPREGAPASEETVLRIAYDDEALYVGVQLLDSAPDSVMARLGRKDADMTTDWFAIAFDSYYDRRSAFYFGVSAGGTLYDGIIYNDAWTDDSWDGVWEGRALRDDSGWSVEMRIPFSQLRFREAQKHVWGVNCLREIGRKNEESYLVYTPKSSSGFVSRFPDLVGIEGIQSPMHVEVLPYARIKAEYTHPDPGDPFRDGSRYRPDAGVDVKMGLSQNLTLDLTVNPDFGQVEVDPAVVNLSDVETYFQEKRPFFLEGASTYRFGQGGANDYWGFNWSSPTFFYTRRIGRPPQGSWPDADFSDVPEGAHILGAAKVTGKLAGAWNVGTVHALTSRETGRFFSNGGTFRSDVEPLSYYGVFRAQKEISNSLRGIGVISTLAARRFDEDRLRAEINRDAMTFGIDGWTFLDTSRTWVLAGWMGGSRIAGTPACITALQRNSRHYYQRDDADHVEVDSAATSLSGMAGRFTFNKQKGNVLFNSALGFISPGFDVNDIGYFYRADVVNGHVGGGYKWTKPGRIFREAFLIGAVFQNLNFGGASVWRGVFGKGSFLFRNYMGFTLVYAYNPRTVNTFRTRGGPSTLNPPGWELDTEFETDNRKALVFELSQSSYWNSRDNWYRGISADLEWKARPNLSLSIGPSLYLNDEPVQWVDRFEDPHAVRTGGARYVFGSMKQTETAANFRLDWTFTPRLSLQLFAQPLISHGDFERFKELDRPRSFAFNEYSGGQIVKSNGQYEVDPDEDGPAASFTFDKPDFNVKSLRGNAVLRWEYRPGSTLYLVWTQDRRDDFYEEPFSFTGSARRLFRARAENIFMLKVSYWWGL